MSSSGRRLTRRHFVHAAAASTAVLAAPTFPRPAISQPIKVRYTLSWLPTGQYAFIYCARQLGYFKQRGIELEIARGYGSMAAIQAVSTGQFDMGGAQTGANLLSILKGLDLHILGTQGYTTQPSGILLWEKTLRNDNVQVDGQAHRTEQKAQHERLASQRPA